MSLPAYVFSKKYTMDWAEHIFPTRKYVLTYQKLIKEGVAKKDDFIEPEMATYEELLSVHTKKYLEELNKMADYGAIYAEIPVNKEVIDAFRLAAGGSIIAVREAMKKGAAGNLSGGFHHAFSEHGEGFCLINDMAVAIKVAQKEKIIRKAAVIDCDLHQGNGTAKIFAGDDNVFTFSIHQEHNYPVKEKSDWDIGLDDFSGDDIYLAELGKAVPKILDKHKPDVVIYQAGADPFEKDQLGLLKITKNGLARRDEIIYENARNRQIPVAVFFGGGYASQVEDVVDIHFTTMKLLQKYFKML